MAVMVYAASLHSTADMLKDIRQEARKLSNDDKFLTQDKFLCLAEKALARVNDTELFNKTDKLIRQLLQYNRDTFFCLANEALKRTRHRKSFYKTDKLIRQLNQYNLNHTPSCVRNTTNVEITLKALLDEIKTCKKIS
ncbi:hypothetical protein JOQ06_024246 [Pogonophryne albipinna]|uniref:Uncharacterized protein n=1 Tax=Pogonophryne albipinna TaxID=1090488 RepID=A0AAD6BLP5_9TELE|nr:hypothetical protein JOQ06_024246 [Pogonophryne albipinna]